jgi:hypothetical protein
MGGGRADHRREGGAVSKPDRYSPACRRGWRSATSASSQPETDAPGRAVAAWPLACESSSSPATSGNTLPRNVVVPLSAVSQFFPEITRETGTGRNLMATGNPKATRMVIYETGDGSRKVTITIDQHGSLGDASSAYQQAVQKSQPVPGYKLVAVPTLGQQTFAGTVTMGAETHIGLGALDHKLIVGATLAGYDAISDNIDKLVAVARMQGAAAKRAAGPSGGR